MSLSDEASLQASSKSHEYSFIPQSILRIFGTYNKDTLGFHCAMS